MNPTTNPMFAKFDQVLGKTTPTTMNAPLTSRADEIRNLGGVSKTTTAAPSKTLGDYTAEAQLAGGSEISDAISEGGKDIQEGTAKGGFGGAGQVLVGMGKSALGTASGALQTIFAPITGAVNDSADHLSDLPIVQQIANSGFGDAIAKGGEHLDNWSAAHPAWAKYISQALNVGLAAIGEKLAPGDVANPILKDTEAIKTGLDNTVNKGAEVVKNTASNIKEAISPTLTPEEKVGKIIQGKTSDIPAAQRTFEALPSESNPAKMTAKDLSDTIQNKVIQKNLETVDTHFANDNNLHPMSDFEQTVGTGKSAVKTNYVQQAIDQLKEFYTKTNDAKGLSDMKALEEKANTNGLSSKELNDLAKEHGSTIKAFNANGEAASGLSKQAAENTRAGVKTTARNTLSQTNPDGATEVTRLDKQTSDAIHTKDLMDKQTEKEAVGVQKNGKMGKISKAYNSKTGKIIRTGLSIEGAKKVLTGGF